MKLNGKTREEIEAALRHHSRSDLLDVVYSLATAEPVLKPSEIASRLSLNKRSVLKDIRAGKFGPYLVRSENSVAVPLSGVNAWKRRFLVTPPNSSAISRTSA